MFREAGIPNLMDRAGDSLEFFFERFGVRPVKVEEQETLFEARYELPKYGGRPRYPEAFGEKDIGFVHFLSGFPYDEAEIMGMLRESTCPRTVDVVQAEGGEVTPPVPKDFFSGFPEADTLHNYLAVAAEDVDELADGLKGEPDPDLLWWLRRGLKLEEGQKWPVPGEFAALAVRLFPGKYWGEQESSPFLFSGNWLDTVYYTTATVEEVLEPDETRPFPLYRVKWRKKDDEPEGANIHLARPSGFERYEAGERVAVLKDPATTRESQTWKDDQVWDKAVWRLVPITFYEAEE